MVRYLLLCGLLFAVPAFAVEPIGAVVKLSGKVSVYRDGAVRGGVIESPDAPLFAGDVIKTKRDSQAFLLFVDGNRVVLTENSSLTIQGLDQANVDRGRVLFEIKKRGSAKGLEISSATVTMGVKGTRFAVNNDADQVDIFLQEGALAIGALEGQFRRYSDRMEAEFKALEHQMLQDFKSAEGQMKAQFEEAKKQMMAGNVEVVSEFTLEAGSAIRVIGDEVWNAALPAWLAEEFALLDQF
ncbi:MAG: FecR family protein [Desulfuromonadales bacterium]|nr:FecR family protein [Desulfuromonadales bacterium]